MTEEGTKSAGPIRMVAIENMMGNIRYKAQIIARSNKYDSALSESGIVGFALGVLVAMILIIVPAVFV
ncbi:MAG TPA: tetrahydromethanopterin S-methyltransferase subunit F [Methanoregulaceae archaeon]|jgi:tetrahydromethanopterin S-methyltransferase subunit F|nr:tetrahydromethanopterin S-methyltransferase subunit F [Methanoregulaceae archaeon]MDD5049063.1 tetrahydromethanopterin S-methyltransferase subunit F [Methanoregulaceae archaeon]MDD5684917.1 tetrahydromethanopterin S-methyltransferase subunit F [Methanoregulaceae archaeon]HOP66958.1 tetrahydromethanopterin S-methyltransferase subunit F [Methanoregulaceae archaeon]HPJ73662.1 tetrahydromethanopterin S-methyltransferase subunit F [Methanoregulaceae archaeon]